MSMAQGMVPSPTSPRWWTIMVDGVSRPRRSRN